MKIVKCIIPLIFIVTLIVLSTNKRENITIPKIILNGKVITNLVEGEKYEEPGYSAYDEKDGDITKKVKIKGTVNYNEEGIYEIVYSVSNSNKEKTNAYRFVKVSKQNLIYKNSYDKIDNTSRGWWSGNKFDHQRPPGGADINELKKYDAYFLGKDDKTIYLTFDEGSYETYLDKVVEVLDKNSVKGTFFLCKNYIEKNPDLIKKMSLNHSIGNHTFHHENMPSLANKENFEKFLSEIKETEKAYYNITKKDMDKIYRDPRGEWSFRDLQIIKDLGYKTFFYSANYDDFSKVLSKEEALNEMLKRYHNGAIYLIHPNNRGNYEALESFITEMKKQGYKFDLVKNIS